MEDKIFKIKDKDYLFCSECKRDVELLGIEFNKDNLTIKFILSCEHNLIFLSQFDSVVMYDLQNGKHKGPEKFSKNHKYKYEFKTGKRISNNGEPVFLNQIKDRQNDLYFELVIDKEGKIIHYCKEKLSEHNKKKKLK